MEKRLNIKIVHTLIVTFNINKLTLFNYYVKEMTNIITFFYFIFFLFHFYFKIKYMYSYSSTVLFSGSIEIEILKFKSKINNITNIIKMNH